MDLYAMREHRTLTVWLGVTLVAVVLAASALIVAKFDGVFAGAVRMTAQLPSNSAVALVNSPVHYRDVQVGKVASAPHSDGRGHIVVDIDIDPGRVHEIPGSVEAAVAPVSIFGNEYVNLVPTDEPASAPLASGSVIPALQQGASPSLQTTFTALDQVLSAVNTAQLNAGLSGLSQALAGRGTDLGHTLVSANTYLVSMLKLWPKLVVDLKSFAPFATTLAASTPAFLDLLRNATVTSRTFASHGDDFTELMTDGGAAANQAAELIGKTMDTYADAVDGTDALLKSLSQSPTVISRLLAGFSSVGAQWSKAISGSNLNVEAAPLDVTNPAALALALVSGQNVIERLQEAVKGPLVNPSTYTAADCPRYGNVKANCGGGKR